MQRVNHSPKAKRTKKLHNITAEKKIAFFTLQKKIELNSSTNINSTHGIFTISSLQKKEEKK